MPKDKHRKMGSRNGDKMSVLNFLSIEFLSSAKTSEFIVVWYRIVAAVQKRIL